MKLYGVCREVGRCVESCGLCAAIGRQDEPRKPSHYDKYEAMLKVEEEKLEATVLPAIPAPPKPIKVSVVFWGFRMRRLKVRVVRPRVACPSCGQEFNTTSRLDVHRSWKHHSFWDRRRMKPATDPPPELVDRWERQGYGYPTQAAVSQYYRRQREAQTNAN